MEISDHMFEKFVRDGIAIIPERFQHDMHNVAFLIDERPSKTQLSENNVPEGDTLLGLYEGIPNTERGADYGVEPTLPDRITLFKEPILEAADGDPHTAAQIVADTIWHEVAHYFGMEEDEVADREHRATNTYGTSS